MLNTKVAVVILNYNGTFYLKKFLKQVISFSAPYEVIVVDNASTDDSLLYLKTHFPNLKTICNSQNAGYAKGYNMALAQIDADYYVLLNNDVEVTSNWLPPLIELMESDKQIAVCQPKLVDQKNKNMFEYAGAAGGFVDKYLYPFCRGRIFNVLEEDTEQYNTASSVFWASGACFAVNAKVYWQAGGLDDDYFAHMEEIDLCWRIKNYGYQIYYQPKSTVFHVGGGTLQKSNATKTYLNFRNNLITLVKNHPSDGLLLKVFVRLVLDGVAGLKFLFSGKITHCLAVIKAHFSFYRLLPKTLKKRKTLLLKTNYKPTLNNTYNGNMVYLHFVKGIKKFSQLKPELFN